MPLITYTDILYQFRHSLVKSNIIHYVVIIVFLNVINLRMYFFTEV